MDAVDIGPGPDAGRGDIIDHSPGQGDSRATPGTSVLSEDPPNRFTGMVWIRLDTSPPQLRVDINGAPFYIALTRVT